MARALQRLISTFRDDSPQELALDTTPQVTNDVRWEHEEEGWLANQAGQVWLYRVLPLRPLKWEDVDGRLETGRQLHLLLDELGATSRAGAGGLRQVSDNREVHLLSLTWEDRAPIPEDASSELREMLEETLDFTVPVKALFVGVQLRVSSTAPRASAIGVKDKLRQWYDEGREAVAKTLGDAPPERERFAADLRHIGDTLTRHGARLATDEEWRQLQSWHNLGRGPDVRIWEHDTHIDIGNFDRLEAAGVLRFRNRKMVAPYAQWVADAAAHPDGPHVVSIRGDLEPPIVTRSRTRKTQRITRAQQQEQELSGDIGEEEYIDAQELAADFEERIRNGEERVMTNTSIIMVRRARQTEESYIDYLRNDEGIDFKPLEGRQLEALKETWPGSTSRLSPVNQDLTHAMLAYTGLAAFSSLGDATGLYTGLVDPDVTTCFLEPRAARREHAPASTLVAGDSGSGKTFFVQALAYQAYLQGYPVIMLNPKAHGSLSGLPRMAGDGGRHIRLSELSQTPGVLDPFGYAKPEDAAQIAVNHIMSVIGQGHGLTPQQEIIVTGGINQAALDGARCVGEALNYIDTSKPGAKEAVDLIRDLTYDPLFAMGLSHEPMRRREASQTLTVIDFDQQLPLPSQGKRVADYTNLERIAIAAVRLATRSSLYMLAQSRGGVFILDEAWAFLNQPEAYDDLEKLGREGRSIGILPVFATQRVSDVTREGRDLEPHFSRYFAFQSREPEDAAEALRLMGLDATQSRLGWLASCGPRSSDEASSPVDMWASCLHKDLRGRRAAIAVGPFPEELVESIRTDKDDDTDTS